MGSRSVAASFNGMVCPGEIRMGFTHGPNAADATVKVIGNYQNATLGQPGMLQVDQSSFFGFLINTEYDWNNNETTLHFVDWRDRLHDLQLFACFNIQEEDGRFYHILPDGWRDPFNKKNQDANQTNDVIANDWSVQRRTYLTYGVKQSDFLLESTFDPKTIYHRQIANKNLYSAFNLLSWLGYKYDFRMVAEGITLQVLKRSFPMNLDWNSGSTLADAIETILAKSNMQSTALPSGVLYVTIKGFAENAFLNAVVNGFVNPCVLGCDNPSVGNVLLESGRRVKIIGDHNKYEYNYACQQNWNPAWTWDLCYGGAKLSAFLKSHSLTRFSKLSDLPEAYRDYETWTDSEDVGEGAIFDKRTRNDMTVQEYIDKIAFKAYVVDFTTAVHQIKTTQLDKIDALTKKLDRETLIPVQNSPSKNLFNYDVTDKWDDNNINAVYPLSRTLNTDSDLQFLVYATNRKLLRGSDSPWSGQHGLVPKNGGLSLDVEEMLNYATGQHSYRVRLFFNQPQFWINPLADKNDPKKILPDKMVIKLCLERELYQYSQGEQLGGFRVREQRLNVQNLYRMFVDNKEVALMKQNFLEELKKDGSTILAQNDIKVDEMARQIATQFLFHQMIAKSGTMDFHDRAGTMPNGLIDDVVVSFDSVNGIQETINFSNTWNAQERIASPVARKVSTKRKDENEIQRDRLRDLGRAAMRDKSLSKKVMTILELGLTEPVGGLIFSDTSISTGFGKDGIVELYHTKEVMEKRPLVPRTIVPFKKAPDPTPEEQAEESG